MQFNITAIRGEKRFHRLVKTFYEKFEHAIF